MNLEKIREWEKWKDKQSCESIFLLDKDKMNDFISVFSSSSSPKVFSSTKQINNTTDLATPRGQTLQKLRTW